ncbi:MAG: type I methionyl aminopeptidase [Patescibacteria group bacterium]
MSIKLKNEKDLEMLRVSGKILAQTLKTLEEKAQVGTKLSELEDLAKKLIKESGAKPSFLGYKPEGAKKGYPAAICASVNEKIVHGIPDDYILKNGDILKIDLGVNYKNYFTDSAITVPIGRVSSQAEKLIQITKDALNSAIKICTAGNRLGDIGFVVEKTVKSAGFSVAKGLTGHGVGFEIHEDPTIYNYGDKGTGMILEPGMVLAIEPMVAIGSGDIKQLADDSFVMKDGSLSAHFEHTIAIVSKSVEILTEL